MFGLTPYSRRSNAAIYNPFSELEDMERTFFGKGSLAEFKTDITDNGKEFVLEADLPGFDKKDIRVDINGDELTISADRRSEREEKKEDGSGYIYRERSFGSFKRSFDVSGVATESVKGEYKDGVLTLTLPKKEQTLPQSRRLDIE